MHSKKFKIVKEFYNQHLWSKERVRNAVIKGWITESEYYEIVGEYYE